MKRKGNVVATLVREVEQRQLAAVDALIAKCGRGEATDADMVLAAKMLAKAEARCGARKVA